MDFKVTQAELDRAMQELKRRNNISDEAAVTNDINVEHIKKKGFFGRLSNKIAVAMGAVALTTAVIMGSGMDMGKNASAAEAGKNVAPEVVVHIDGQTDHTNGKKVIQMNDKSYQYLLQEQAFTEKVKDLKHAMQKDINSQLDLAGMGAFDAVMDTFMIAGTDDINSNNFEEAWKNQVEQVLQDYIRDKDNMADSAKQQILGSVAGLETIHTAWSSDENNSFSKLVKKAVEIDYDGLSMSDPVDDIPVTDMDPLDTHIQNLVEAYKDVTGEEPKVWVEYQETLKVDMEKNVNENIDFIQNQDF